MNLSKYNYESTEKQLDELFKEWQTALQKEQHAKLIRDGCINPQQYAQTEPKIVILIDTPQDIQPTETITAHIPLTDQQSMPTALQTCSKWAYGILHGFPPYDMVCTDLSKKRYALHSIAFCYVHKIQQNTVPDNNELASFAEKYQTYLHQQLTYLAADIVICCLQWDKALWRTITGKDVTPIASGYEVPLCRFGNSKVIGFYHPGTHLPDVLTYCLLEKIVNSYGFSKV